MGINTNAPKRIQDMFVLGTVWVSKQEYLKMGAVRTIPMKGVTAPLADSEGFGLVEGEFQYGGNSHKFMV